MKPSPRLFRNGALVALTLFLLSFVPLPAEADIVTTGPYRCEEDLIEIMFSRDAKVRLREGELVDLGPPALPGVDAILVAATMPEWERACDVPEAKLDELRRNGVARTGESLYDLNNTFRVRIAPGRDVWRISRDLEALPGVHRARPVPAPVVPPVPADYEPQQGYLRPAAATPTGIDADWAWTQPGGDGLGVTVCDLEYGWFRGHTDVTQAPAAEINPNPLALPSGATDDHGTAVIGELCADRNSFGATGVCYGATLKTCGTYYGSPPAWNVPAAIAMAAAVLGPGDVILLEQQWDYFGTGDHIPIEWWTDYAPAPQSYNAVYAAIATAIANGIHVVEAAGNSQLNSTGVDTDLLTWQGDSGAIIVGAGGAYPGGSYPSYPQGDCERLYFSAHGQRIDLQGWGEDVLTTGYGSYYNAEGKNLWYTNTFSGTSSASPIVAGAVASCVGYWKSNISPNPPPPATIRDILKTTGSPQVYGIAGKIGPRPNLAAAIPALANQWADATAGPLGNAGQGYGVAWADVDGDADPDLYVTNSTGNQLLRNDGGSFYEITGPIGGSGVSEGSAWGDYDNDGDPDLFITNYGAPNVLWRNDGGGTMWAGVGGPSISDNGPGITPAWADYDKDGDLDLYMVNYGGPNQLLRNDGAAWGITNVAAPPIDDFGWGTGAAWGDYDNDGDPDLYLANYGYANKLFRNDGGTFVDATTGPLGDASWGTGVAWGDYDNDGDLDLYLGNVSTANRLFRNDGGGAFVDVAASTPLADTGFAGGLAWEDYDNDGDLDLYLANNYSSNRLFRNEGGWFQDVTPPVLGYTGYSQGVGWADADGDGDRDLFVANFDGPNRLYKNGPGSQLNWLDVELVGTTSNRAGVGARVRVHVGGNVQMREISASAGYLSQSDLVAHFGLGTATGVDSVVVTWPSGATQDTLLVGANGRIVLTEPIGVDAPMIAAGGWTNRLEASRPNPFRSATDIVYEVAAPTRVTLAVFDVTGRRVRTLVDETVAQAGRYRVTWDGRTSSGTRAASGVYFTELDTGAYRATRRAVLLR